MVLYVYHLQTTRSTTITNTPTTPWCWAHKRSWSPQLNYNFYSNWELRGKSWEYGVPLYFDVNVMTLETCQENVSRRTNQFGIKNKTICLGIYVSKINLFISVTLHNMNINIKNSIYRFSENNVYLNLTLNINDWSNENYGWNIFSIF